MSVYYNEIDPYAAGWLRNLIAAGHIAAGDVDERSITEVTPDDLAGYTQCHFFAGIGCWSYALRCAGWADARPVWTGSCPCQPFSAAGQGNGASDPRHLWPAWFKLIRQCRPVTVFGEQVASADGLAWLDLVHADLEEAGYAVGALDLCAAGAGAPHIRQRIYFVADAQHDGGRTDFAGREAQGREYDGWTGADGGLADAQQSTDRRETRAADNQRAQAVRPTNRTGGCGGAGTVGNAAGEPVNRDARGGEVPGQQAAEEWRQPGRTSNADELGHATGQRCGEAGQRSDRRSERATISSATIAPWSDAIWLDCRDGKQRPAPPEPEFQPLAYGAAARVGPDGTIIEAPSRVGMLKGYGNAIVAPLASAFIAAYMDTLETT